MTRKKKIKVEDAPTMKPGSIRDGGRVFAVLCIILWGFILCGLIMLVTK